MPIHIYRNMKKRRLAATTKPTQPQAPPPLVTIIIGDLLDRNMVLIPLAIDPFGHFGPILQTFLFDTQPTTPITFTPTKPIATLMYSKITHFPSPKGILKIAGHNWKLIQT